ncbi:ATP-binding protein, partial [Streptomyces albidoflavus]|uniref:ATP-binding protein n=1 Tax=Streptomyces albidoflavus TaxID=1886 RepID=UPI00211C5480
MGRSTRHGPHAGSPPGRSERPGPDRKAGARLHRTLHHADLRSVPEVRRALRALLRPRLAEEQAATAEVLASEVLTNALIHSDHDALFTATVHDGSLRVEVRDFTGRPPRPRTPRPLYTSDAAAEPRSAVLRCSRIRHTTRSPTNTTTPCPSRQQSNMHCTHDSTTRC